MSLAFFVKFYDTTFVCKKVYIISRTSRYYINDVITISYRLFYFSDVSQIISSSLSDISLRSRSNDLMLIDVWPFLCADLFFGSGSKKKHYISQKNLRKQSHKNLNLKSYVNCDQLTR